MIYADDTILFGVLFANVETFWFMVELTGCLCACFFILIEMIILSLI